MKKLNTTEAELKKSVAHKKSVYWMSKVSKTQQSLKVKNTLVITVLDK